MNKQEAFKIGFLSRCIEDGCSPQEIDRRAKLAADLMTKEAVAPVAGAAAAAAAGAGYGTLTGAWDNMKNLFNQAPGLVAAGMVAPYAIGGTAAYLNHMSNEAADETPDGGSFAMEEAKKLELADEYRRMTQQLEQQKRIRDYKQQRKRTGQVFL